MKISKRLAAVTAAGCVAVSFGFAGSASAAFPNFTGCPTSTPNINGCLDIESQSGNIIIKGFNVPLDHSLSIRGAVASNNDGSTYFVPAAGTNGFIAQPVDVPGGLLGINLPISLNKVTATATLAGPSSNIRVDLNTLSISVPIILRLSNPLIGPGCQIGTTSNPAQLNLITGTTSPPPPNTPISGHAGTVSFPGNYVLFSNALNVDNSFAVPGASGCGLGLGLINAIVDAKLKLPSASGNNTITVANDVAFGGLS